MAIQILSDLHLELPKAYDIFKIVRKAEYLALLGDIGNVVAHKDDFLAFLTRQLKQFKAVLFVPGNHEAYHSSWERTFEILRDFEKEVRNNPSLGEFVLLDRAVYHLQGRNVAILGCSLFSSIPKENHEAVSMGVNDFYQITDWTTEIHNETHERDVAWLNAQVADLERSNADIVILSHWSPSQDTNTMDSRHTGSAIASGFSTDMSAQPCFNSTRVKVWAFGHTHYNCDWSFDRGGDARALRLVTNQRGYYFSQAKGFDPEKTIFI